MSSYNSMFNYNYLINFICISFYSFFPLKKHAGKYCKAANNKDGRQFKYGSRAACEIKYWI